MSIESEIFKRKKVDFKKLIQYGFIKENDIYRYSCLFMNNEFEAEIIVNQDGKMIGKVYDTDFHDEYIQFRFDHQNGEFVSKVREEYISILQNIAENCFVDIPFLFDQTNRITRLIEKQYKHQPDFLWEDTPGCGVFRNSNNKKWYGLIMNIDRSKIDNSEGEIEILNVKLPEGKIKELLKKKGYYQAYHMNKKHWITIILDDTLSDEQIMEHVFESYHFTERKKEWLIPANPQYYDIINCFHDTDTILWKQSSKINVGDIIYMYVAKPYSAILYQCQAIEVDIPYSYEDDNLSMKYVMKIKLLKRYNQNQYTFDVLKKYGVKAIRGPRYMPKTLIKKMNNEDESLIENISKI